MGDIKKEIGQRIRLLRRRRGLTQEDMADRCGLHWTYIGGLERGERNPTLTTMEKIATGLSIGIHELLDPRQFSQKPGLREKKEGRLLRLLRKKDEKTLELASSVVREILQWKDKYGGDKKLNHEN